MDVNEEFVKNSKKKNFWGGGGVGVELGGQSGCERRIEIFVKIHQKKFFGGGVGWVGGVVGGGGGGGSGSGEGLGWM